MCAAVQEEIYCLLGASEARLAQEAARVDYDLRLDEEQVVEQGRRRKMKLMEARGTACLHAISLSFSFSLSLSLSLSLSACVSCDAAAAV